MTLPKHGKILDVYLETAQSQAANNDRYDVQESQAFKLTFFNITRPEWAVGALRRNRNVKKVVDYGETSDDVDVAHYAVKVIYDTERNTDASLFMRLIRSIIESSGIRPSHL